MDNEWQLNSNNEQGMGLNPGNETAYPNWINHMEEYDIDALLDAEDHVNTDQDEDDEEHHHDGSKSSKRGKNRFTAKQIEQLESLFQLSAHPDDPTRQELADKIGLEARQVKFWFQNQRTKTKAKAVGDQNKDIKQENAQLHAENMKLQQTLACGRCRDPTEHKWHLLNENARLKDTKRRAQEYLIKLIHDSNLPHSETLEHLESASLNLVPFDDNGSTYQATLLSYAERALNEFMMLAVKDEPMWLPTINGKMLHNQEYNCRTCPGLLGPCPQGFVMEATKQTTTVRGTASDLVAMLTDVSCWSKMFPGIIESVRASKVVSSGISTSRDGLIQEVHCLFKALSKNMLLSTISMVVLLTACSKKAHVLVAVTLLVALLAKVASAGRGDLPMADV
ncbi:homeobox-leucine zipper protein ROC6-like [Setaria italica]|uniref:homeobox-leucine zipper protein ROC6-like n=1 Tax=Setaria italica TaxID=4555 RepID=UPI000350E6AD|nr:homeobox-leucine zipper protein ROC6-like [Setaria italica]